MALGNVDSRTETIPASGIVKLSNGNFFFLISATSNITLKFLRGGSSENFSGVQAGIQISRIRPWQDVTVTGAAGTILIFFYGYTDVREDNTLFNQQIAVIAGTTAVAETPSASFVDTVDNAQAAGTQTVIAANLARRRITIGVLSTAGNGVRVSFTGGSNNRGIEVQPGTFVEFRTTAALTVRNADVAGTAAASNWYAEEES